MPCATIHMLTAGRVLDGWTRRPALAPVPLDTAGARNAFLLGAMGPDVGFVPGVDRFVSELAHYVSTGDLTRALLREAETVAQRAFAWGWATHHVTDVQIHPLVGLACGEHLRGDRTLRMNASEDVGTHVAMEVGLDIVFLGDDDAIPRPPARAPFDIDFVARALEATYDIPWASRAIRRALGRAYALTHQWPTVLGLLGRGYGILPGDGHRANGAIRVNGRRDARHRAVRSILRRALDLAEHLVPSGRPTAGFLRPLSPPRWLVSRVRELADAFPERFQAQVEDELERVENRNLETGRLEEDPVDHPDSERTVLRLRELQGG